MFWGELLVLLLVIFWGARLQGMSLGILGGLGLTILTFCFHVKPQNPPFTVLLCITAVVTAVGTVEAAGGLQYVIQVAEKFIKKRPNHIIFISPLVTYLVVFLTGTGHIIYSILPIIAIVAKDVGIRPERPLSLSVIAGLHAVISSPISAPMALIVSLLGPQGITILTILKVLIIATLGGIIIATVVVNCLPKQLPKEVTDNLTNHHLTNNITTIQASKKPTPVTAKWALLLFMLGSLLIVLVSSMAILRPSWTVGGVTVPLSLTTTQAIIMLATAAIIMLVCGVKSHTIVQGKAFTAGIQALISILGIAWLSDTFIQANFNIISTFIDNHITAPWQFSIIVFFMSAIMLSNTATIRAMIPLGIALGIPFPILLACLPAVNGLFCIPSYPTILAAIHLDDTGTTRVGKFIINHSFLLPGLVSTIAAVMIAFGLSS